LGIWPLKFLETDCADGLREGRAASVLRGAARLFMSETSPSPPLNFYIDFQNPKLNTQTLCYMCRAPERHMLIREREDLPV